VTAEVSALPALAGLAIALGGIALLVSPAHRLLGPAERLRTRVLDQLALWSLLGGVLAVTFLWEERGFASLGLRPFHAGSLAWGIALALFLGRVAYPATLWLLRALRLPAFESGFATVLAWPLWLRVFAVVTAGVVEEALFRGYAIERLALFTGDVFSAALLTLAAFALVHWPLWGAGPVISFFFTGGVLTAFFVWRADLLANIVAHVSGDAWGLIVGPWFARRARA
jgi:membrane protease YdiL (CAAX protease family)